MKKNKSKKRNKNQEEINKVIDEKSKPPYIGLYPHEEINWKFRDWRFIYKSQYSNLRNKLLLKIIKINFVILIVGIIIGIILNIFSLSISSDSLLRILNVIVSASATILAIITAFLTFWFGNAISNMAKAKSDMNNALAKIAEIRESVDKFKNGPTDEITGELRGKVLILAEKSKAYLDALRIFSNRFHRASIGSYYDSIELSDIESVVNHTGGEWFVAHRNVFTGWDAHDFSRRIFVQSMDAVRGFVNRCVKIIMQLQAPFPV